MRLERGSTIKTGSRIVAIFLIVHIILGHSQIVWSQAQPESKSGISRQQRGAKPQGPVRGMPRVGPSGRIGVTAVSPSETELAGGTALSKAVVPDKYVLGPGDSLTVNIWGEYDDTYEVRVTPDGKISLPTIGDLQLKGLTLAEAQKLVETEVKKYFRNVKSGLSLTALRVFEVQVLGEVVQPGVYLATPLKHVSDVVLQAGGVLPGGSERRLQILRDGYVVATADLTLFFRRGDESLNPTVQDGDKILVPPLGDQRVTLYVSEVLTGGMSTLAGGGAGASGPGSGGGGSAVTERLDPHIVEIKEGDHLSSVLSEVGGVSPWWDLDAVLIQRYTKSPEGEMRIPVNLNAYIIEGDATQDPILVKGDIVYIPALIKRVLVAGSVKAPAAYPYIPGKSAEQYLMQAGGATIIGDLDRSLIQRADGTVEPYNPKLELNNGDSIVVLERLFKTWQDYFALVGTITGVILSAVGFYAALTGFGN